MNEDKKRVFIKIVIIFVFIGIPIIIMFYDTAIGGFLLVAGMYSTVRAIRYLGNQYLQFDSTHQLHNANASGKTILVQIVDNHGRELPSSEVAKRLEYARAKAGPRDNVTGVTFQVESNQNISNGN